MLKVSLDLTGKDSVFISKTYRYHSGLCTLDLYRDPPAGLAPSDIKPVIDAMQQAYEGGTTGNRGQITLRRSWRKQVTEMFQRVLLFVRLVATEKDIPALLDAGFTVRQHTSRKKVVVAPAT